MLKFGIEFFPFFKASKNIMNDKSQPVYRIIFQDNGQVFEVYAKQIYQSDFWGFLEVEDFIFGERSQVLIDPSEEKLKMQFEGVERSYLPLHNILRIDEVKQSGRAKIQPIKGSGTRIINFQPPKPPIK